MDVRLLGADLEGSKQSEGAGKGYREEEKKEEREPSERIRAIRKGKDAVKNER